MPKLTKRLTDKLARDIPAPSVGYEIHWCAGTPGFGLRVTAAGARAYIGERRVDGKTVRRTLGKAAGAAAISAEAARRLQLDVSSELQQGQDRLAQRREARGAEKQEGLTVAAALRDYVNRKRRAKDGKALKPRTVGDYLGMLEPGRALRSGEPTQPGALFALAEQPLHRITAADIQRLHASLASRGVRQQTYAMQVLRALLRHHGIQVQDNPLSSATAGARRVVLAPSAGKPTPIPPEQVGAWWRAACAIDTPGADQLRFQLLTGCRPGEVAGIRVRDVDTAGWRVTLHDTKNRSDHVLVLSTQAQAIVQKHLPGKKPSDSLFGVGTSRRVLQTINATAGVAANISSHKLRHTFASLGATLVPVYSLKRMLNHAAGSDITGAAYVHVGEAQLRAAWQVVADAIEAAPLDTA